MKKTDRIQIRRHTIRPLSVDQGAAVAGGVTTRPPTVALASVCPCPNVSDGCPITTRRGPRRA